MMIEYRRKIEMMEAIGLGTSAVMAEGGQKTYQRAIIEFLQNYADA